MSLLITLFGVTIFCAKAAAQGAIVSLRVRVDPSTAVRQKSIAMPMAANDTVVVWLTPVNSPVNRPLPLLPGHGFVLTQKNKQFSPHLLVVPTGSSVDFPNEDPFFHNVFSLYNGRRFDLGLYEAGSRRSVRFDHDGVSYIFCNIHPEMAAVVVSLSTPYYAVSNSDGAILLAGIPPGEYRLSLWSQNVLPADAAAATKSAIHVAETNLTLPDIMLKRTTAPTEKHLNKFGEAYKKADTTVY